MKCPKCDYVGFETADRCRICGYDFSLASAAPRADHVADLPLRDAAVVEGAPDPLAPIPLDVVVAAPPVRSAPRAERVAVSPPVPPLPLFGPGMADDEPLVKLPSAPRPPLAVRKTPPRQRPRSTPPAQAARRPVPSAPMPHAPALFSEEPPAEERASLAPTRESVVAALSRPVDPWRRLWAAAMDHAILAGIDVTVIYFTLRMADLLPADWEALPALPLLAFLGMLKVFYFSAFTAVGGQTIGKMAAQIRVVAEDSRALEPGQAVRRTMAGALSLLPAGLGFLPVFMTGDRRALHDRLARTRVVAVRSA